LIRQLNREKGWDSSNEENHTMRSRSVLMTVVFVACADNAGDEQAGTDTTVVATDSVAAVTPDNAASSSGMLDPNTAGADQIAAIPGLTPELAQAVVRGPRMRHEFEEYRPYTSLEQFRREIGKYVDETEVARLEKYVAIRPAGQ
jgi:DNA uptake protein ComE-like DNA-binding protein